MSTLAEALQSATHYWDNQGLDSRMMGVRARLCVDHLGGSLKLTALKEAHALSLLTHLSSTRSRSTVQSYYAAFRRMLSLAGVSTATWPKAPKPGRKAYRSQSMELTAGKLLTVREALRDKGYATTAHLIRILLETGMRVDVEALSWDAWVRVEEDYMVVRGKGGHERVIPLREGLADYFTSCEKLIKRVPYNTHYKRLRQVAPDLDFHDIRRWYATEAYKRTKDIRAVQELLGHADVSTTARYIGVDEEALRKAAGV